ncbi:MAG: trigger factor [Gammaproteobacteria bacterium]
MQVSVEAPSKIQRRVTVVVPVEKLDQAYDQRIIKLSQTAKVNGFRPGKVPLDVIKQRFGDSARQEALSEVIQSSLYSAMDQEKLSPVGVPMVEPKTVVIGQPLEFVATFDILPVIEKVHFNVLTLEKQIAVIKDEDVERVIQHLREQQTVWNKVEREAQEKDQVVVDFSGSIDGVVFQGGEAHDYPIVLGSKTMIPGFEEGIMGMKTGEHKVISVKFADDYFAKEVAGKNAEFKIHVRKVMEPHLPAIDAAFIKKLGVKSASIEDLRVEIRNNLERELDRVIKLKLKGQVFDKLLEQNALEIPKALIEREANRIHDELHPHHKGHDHGHTEAEMAQFNDAATRNVALGILVGEFIKESKITPDRERIKNHISSIAAAYENPSEVSKWYETNKRALAEVEMQVLEEQVVEKLLEGVQVTEKLLSYQELAANNQII